MPRLEVRKISWSHKKHAGKNKSQMGPTSSYNNITFKKSSIFLLFSRFQNRAPEAQVFKVSRGSKFAFQLEPKRKKNATGDWI